MHASHHKDQPSTFAGDAEQGAGEWQPREQPRSR